MDNDGFYYSSLIIKNPKMKENKTMDIEPWKDEPQTLPLSLFSVESERIPIKSQTTYKIDKIKRNLSDRELHSKSTSLSPRKEWRTSTVLPKMNIGNINIKPKMIAIHLNKEVDRKNKKRSVSPSFGCVNKELAIERKLFLMNNNANRGSKKRNLREYVEQYAYTIK